MRRNPDFMLEAVKRNPLVLADASRRAWDDKAIVLEAVGRNGLVLEFASPALKVDREVVREAISENGCALRFAPSFWFDKEMITAAVASTDEAFNCLPGYGMDMAVACISANPGTLLRVQSWHRLSDRLINAARDSYDRILRAERQARGDPDPETVA